MPQRRQTRRSVSLTSDGRMSTIGALVVTNTRRDAVAGRRCSHPANVSPTSVTSGRRSTRRALPQTTNSPARQSMSSSSSRATSTLRRPSRATIVKMARSRTPVSVTGSQAPNSRATSGAFAPLGTPLSCQPATGGTEAARACSVRPVRNRNRNNDRISVTRPLAEPTLTRAVSASKNVLTSRPVNDPSGRSPTRSRNRAARFSYRRTVEGASPRSSTIQARYSPISGSTGAGFPGVYSGESEIVEMVQE